MVEKKKKIHMIVKPYFPLKNNDNKFKLSSAVAVNLYKGNVYTLRGGNSSKFVASLFWKGVYSKRKESAPLGSKFFSFRIDHQAKHSRPLSEESEQEVTKVVSFVKHGPKGPKCTKRIQSP